MVDVGYDSPLKAFGLHEKQFELKIQRKEFDAESAAAPGGKMQIFAVRILVRSTKRALAVGRSGGCGQRHTFDRNMCCP